jgi:hypothetical protein
MKAPQARHSGLSTGRVTSVPQIALAWGAGRAQRGGLMNMAAEKLGGTAYLNGLGERI